MVCINVPWRKELDEHERLRCDGLLKVFGCQADDVRVGLSEDEGSQSED